MDQDINNSNALGCIVKKCTWDLCKNLLNPLRDRLFHCLSHSFQSRLSSLPKGNPSKALEWICRCFLLHWTRGICKVALPPSPPPPRKSAVSLSLLRCCGRPKLHSCGRDGGGRHFRVGGGGPTRAGSILISEIRKPVLFPPFWPKNCD